jgi:DNA (cytosine-5)-methyltransferase 1
MQLRATHLDLFSGIGGFAIAAQNCGYETVAFCEKEKYAQQILKERFGAVLADADNRRQAQRQIQATGDKQCRQRPKLHDDIFTLDGADYAGVDLLTGGFPCQPFSVAGKRRGAEDDRAIWPQMLRVIREAKPTWIIGENVAGIVTMELDNILSDLESVGYSAWPIVIPACAVDARHRRDRVWIVAYADSQRGRLREDNGSDASDARQSPRPRQRQDGGQLESTICGMADGLPEGLDGGSRFCQWPKEDYSTPRVTTGIKHRAHRLKGLGNSIVPQVAEEIIQAITNLI